MIKVEDLTYAYDTGRPALKDVSIDFVSDHIFAVLGESGSGKTTLLSCLGRFAKPQQGRVLLDGINVLDIPEADFRRRVGIVFQQLHLFPHLTILENMTLAVTHVRGRARRDADREAAIMLDRLGIGELGAKYPAQISGGQAQRAAIARGLALEPEHMLLDEPTSALDANTTDDFAQWLRELQSSTQFIIVTHDTLFAESVASRGVLLADGGVAATGTVAEMVKRVRSTPE